MTLTGPEYRQTIKPWLVEFADVMLPAGSDFTVCQRIPECSTCHIRFVIPPPGFATSIDAMVDIADMEAHSKLIDWAQG